MRKAKNDALRAAFEQSGHVLVVELKKRNKRAQELREFTYQTFVGGMVPEGRRRRYDVFKRAIDGWKQKSSKLHQYASDEKTLNGALMTLKYTWTSKLSYKQACELFE